MDSGNAGDGTQDEESSMVVNNSEDDHIGAIETDYREPEPGAEVEVSAQDLSEPGKRDGVDDENLELVPCAEPCASEQSGQKLKEPDVGGEPGLVGAPLESDHCEKRGHVSSEVARTKSGRSRANNKQNLPNDKLKSPTPPVQPQTGDLRDLNEDSVPRSPERPRIEYNTLVQVSPQPAGRVWLSLSLYRTLLLCTCVFPS